MALNNPLTRSLLGAQNRNLLRAYGGGGGGGSDPDFAEVVLLLDMNGIDNATEILDLSDSGHTMQFLYNAHISTDEFKFGTASLEVDNVDDHLRTANSTDFQIVSGDFTVEAHINGRDFGETNTIMGHYRNDNQGWYWRLESNGNMRFAFATSPTASVPIDRAGGMSINTWYHVAITREGDFVRHWVDGVQVGVDYDMTGAAAPRDSTYDLLIGGNMVATSGDKPSSEFDGWIDNVRITKGTARYTTGGFTPPTEEYPTS